MNLKQLLFWLCIFSIAGKVYSQNYYKEYETLLNSQSTLTSTVQKTVDSLISEATQNKKLKEGVKIAHDFSVAFYRQGHYENAIKYVTKEINIFKKIDNKLDKKLSNQLDNAIFNLALFHVKNRDFETSIAFYSKVIERNIDSTRVARSYCAIGRNYDELGDFYKAISYYKRGISLLEEQKNYEQLVSNQINFSYIYETINTKESLQQQIYLLKKTSLLSKQLVISDNDFYALHNSYAFYYTSEKGDFNFTKAKKHYLLNLTRALEKKDTTTIGSTYTNLGKLYNTFKKDSAHYYLNLAGNYGKEPYREGIKLHELSNYFKHKKDLKEALSYINQSISTTVGRDLNDASTIAAIDFIDNSHKIETLESFIKKASILIELHQQDHSILYIEQAMETILVADQLIDIIQSLSSERQSELYWRSKASNLYFLGVYCSDILKKEDLTFYFTEKNKVLLLTESIIKNTKRSLLPRVIAEKETSLKKNILTLEHKVSISSDNDDIKKSETLLFSKKLEYQKLTDSLTKIYPSYFSNQNESKLFSLKEIQGQLDKNTIVVNYIWNETDDLQQQTYGVIISKNDAETFKIPKSESFNELLIKYRLAISKPFEVNEEIEQFKNTSFQLFNHLFPNVTIRESLKNKKLLIISDSDLLNIPFEALITELNTEKYLIKSNEISYAYSMSSLLHNASVKRQAINNFIGFAPVSFKNNTLDSLPNSISEINTINKIQQGDIYKRSSASKRTFLEIINNYKVIHLATHASASGEPWIAFNDEKLKLNELYTLQNQAELIVMSSCDTSLGEIANGEGILSLTRGFFYSGANSVISSLWKVNDKNTATFFPQFYTNLKKGQTKSEALRNAKLTYLETHSLSQVSPYYWAPFILVGDTVEKINETNTYNNYILIIAVSILLLLSIVYYIRKNKLFRKI